MKRHVLLTIFALAGVAFSAQDDALITFSTQGTDKYADNETVLDGECYALVWTAPGNAVAFEANGGVKGGEIVLVAPVAQGGRCPKVLFEVDAERHAEKLTNGTWSVYLLDTRRWGADGSVSLAGTADGVVQQVNAAGTASGAEGVVASAFGAKAASPSLVAAEASAVPETAPCPQITGIRVVGAAVHVTVKSTVPYLQYGLVAGSSPTAVTEKADGQQTGAGTLEDEIEFVSPVGGEGRFFKVGRR